MSRRTRAVKRPIIPDPVYGSESVTKFVNTLMLDGKKSTAEGIFYDAMKTLEERTGQPLRTQLRVPRNKQQTYQDCSMSRKGSPGTRSILPDPKHGSEMVARFINMVMKSGKKSIAEKIVYGAMDVIGQKNADSLGLVEKALSNVAPAVEVKSRRVGGATYQVPVEVRSSRRTALAMRWVIDSARKRGENTMPRKLAAELLEASENRGGAVKKREETHRMAEANKAFSHYRW